MRIRSLAAVFSFVVANTLSAIGAGGSYVPPSGSASSITDGAGNAVITGSASQIQSGLTHWFAGGIAGKHVAIVGDSTSDATGNASLMWSVLSQQVLPGHPFDGVVFENYGKSGQTAEGFVTDSGTQGMQAVISDTAVKLVVYSFGINSERLSATGAALSGTIAATINTIRQARPDIDFVLREPNSLCSENDGYFSSPRAWSSVTDQNASADMHSVYMGLVNRWPNVVVMPVQGPVFPQTVLTGTLAVGGFLMSDELHPGQYGYNGIIIQMALTFGNWAIIPQSLQTILTGSAQGNNLIAIGYTQPYLINPYALDNTDLYSLIYTGYLSSGNKGTNFFRMGAAYNGNNLEPTSASQSGLFVAGDIVREGGTFPGWQAPSVGVNASNIDFQTTSPNSGFTGGMVRVYRDKFRISGTTRTYTDNPTNYPWSMGVYVYTGGNGFVGFTSCEPTIGGNAVTSFRAGDVLATPGVAPVTMDFSSNIGYYPTSTSALFQGSNNYSGFVGKYCRIFGQTRSVAIFSGTVAISSGSGVLTDSRITTNSGVQFFSLGTSGTLSEVHPTAVFSGSAPFQSLSNGQTGTVRYEIHNN